MPLMMMQKTTNRGDTNLIRYPFIYNQVLKIYNSLDEIVFPLDPALAFASRPNCRIMTYEEIAQVANCSIDKIILTCESKSGCTHYDIANDRYLILYNSSPTDNNVLGRIRWTKAHELGHVVLNHLPYIAEPMIAENTFSSLTNPELEAEADHFAAMLLAPFPSFKLYNIQSPLDIKRKFGLSAEASQNRFTDYLKWQRSHRKTAWENDLLKLLILQ